MIGDDEQVESKIDANTSALFLTLTAESSGFCKTFESFNASKKGRIEYMNGEEAAYHCGTYLAIRFVQPKCCRIC